MKRSQTLYDSVCVKYPQKTDLQVEIECWSGAGDDNGDWIANRLEGIWEVTENKCLKLDFGDGCTTLK